MVGETGNLRLRIPRFDQSSMSFPRSLLYLQYLPFFGDKWLVGVGTVVFDVDDSGGDHFYQGEAFA
mgnify:CR=1 FL=1